MEESRRSLCASSKGKGVSQLKTIELANQL